LKQKRTTTNKPGFGDGFRIIAPKEGNRVRQASAVPRKSPAEAGLS
jgi:hypothetical protein